MKANHRYTPWNLAVLLASLSVFNLTMMNAARADVEQAAPVQPLPLEDLRTFTETFERIKTHYVEPVDDKELLENAIRGMLSGLDPHSNYLDPEDFMELQSSTSGEFGGLGIEVGWEDGVIKVISPIDDTPAEKAGILPGDLIIRLDGQSVQGMDLNDAVKLMRGEVGSEITLTIIREGESQPLEIAVERAVIKVTSIKNQVLDNKYGYVRISQFQVDTGRDLEKAMAAMKKETDLKGYILDLRNNPGGVLQAAVGVSDAFLTDGLIVYTKGRIKQAELRYTATPSDPSDGVPVVVLINGGSASASEIVAGALQDQKRAIVMGTPSFGKGSVQTVLPLTNDRALKLTTARYYTPSGRSIQAEGIVPDIFVEPSTVTRVEAPKRLKEANLAGHLSNGNKSADTTEDAQSQSSDVDVSEEVKLLSQDYQLREALNLLKGIAIYQR